MLVVISSHLILKTPSHDLLLLYRDTTSGKFWFTTWSRKYRVANCAQVLWLEFTLKQHATSRLLALCLFLLLGKHLQEWMLFIILLLMFVMAFGPV